MDVKTTFVNGDIEEEFYIEQFDGFVIHEKASHMYMLEKALYGLKHAPRAWYEKIRGYLMRILLGRAISFTSVTMSVSSGNISLLVPLGRKFPTT